MTHPDNGDVAYGFVKTNPLNNAEYLRKAVAALPELEDILTELDANIEKLAPGYNIAQIKVKFNGLRYYVDLPIDPPGGPDAYDEVYSLIREAEEAAYPLLNP